MQTATTREIRGLLTRASFLTGALLLLFVILLFRYFHLMVVRHEEYRALASRQILRTEELRGFRGSILDRRGRDLALTQSLPSVAVDPSRVAAADRDRFARDVAAALDLEPAFVRGELDHDCYFRWLRRQVRDRAAMARLRALGYDDAIIVREEPARSYPNGSAAAQVLGFTNVDGKGLSGLEAALDRYLAPCPGHRTVLRDGWGSRRISSTPPEFVEPPENGADVTLALELSIQNFAEEALTKACEEWSPKSAVAVVLDPRNGDVLALASRPTFDPESWAGAEADRYRVRAVTDAYVVGSTMKPLVAAAALDAGVVSYHESFDCTDSGVWRYQGRRIRDHGKGLGTVPFPMVIIESSNIGAAQIGLRLGIDRTWRLFRALGFHEGTGSGIPGDVAGQITRRRDWTEKFTLCSVSYGQEITLTPLQFATAFASLLNGGILYRPRVVLRIGDREVAPEARRQVYSEEVATRLMTPLLTRVVAEGTGKPARIPGYRVGGKTGTAQKIDKQGAVYGYVGSFAGFAPASAPRFLVYVVMDEPTREKGTPYGGRCAAPAVREILERCLKYAEIPPDDPAETAAGR